MNRRCAVYRHYSDTGRLLYVGQSFDPIKRWETLQVKEAWTYLSVRRVDHWLPSKAEAKLVERIAIKTEAPLFNVQGIRGIGRSSHLVHTVELARAAGSVLPCRYSSGTGWMIGDDAFQRACAGRTSLRAAQARVHPLLASAAHFPDC